MNEDIELIARRAFREGRWIAPKVAPTTDPPKGHGGQYLRDRVFRERDEDLAVRGVTALHRHQPLSEQLTAAYEPTSRSKPRRRRVTLNRVLVAFIAGLVIGPVLAALLGIEIVLTWQDADRPTTQIEIGR